MSCQPEKLCLWHDLLCADDWKPASECFWEAKPCFYDLSAVKTVILFRTGNDCRPYAEVYYWKHGPHGLPEYLDAATAEIRRYKLHHSMNDLLWHDHGDRPLWPQ